MIVLLTCPKVYPAPRGEMPQPPRSSGSDQRRSHIGPWNEISQRNNSLSLLWNGNGERAGKTCERGKGITERQNGKGIKEKPKGKGVVRARVKGLKA